MQLSKYKKISSFGFTLVELLISISILGILASVTAVVVNTNTQQGRARDALLRRDIEQTVEGIESFYVSEDYYPSANAGAPNDPYFAQYVDVWPTSVIYVVNAARTSFAVYVPLSNGSYLKYSSNWTGIRNCKATNISQIDYCDPTST